MRWVWGLSLLVATFAATGWLTELGYVGLYNTPALLLISVAPLAISFIAYEPRELLEYLRLLGRAARFTEGRARDELREGLVALARALRGGDLQQAVSLVERTNDEWVRLTGTVLLKRYEVAEIREVFAAHLGARLSRIKRAEECFVGLARLAPSFGLIGTILGFIDLLGHIDDPSALGPGMGMALTATLYGIALSYCLFHPAAKSVGSLGRKLLEQAKLAEHAAVLTRQGQGVADLDVLLRVPAAGAVYGAAAARVAAPLREASGG